MLRCGADEVVYGAQWPESYREFSAYSVRVRNTTLLCGFHHREHAKRGWTVRLVHGMAEWIPPRWIDPQQVPRRNNTHHVPLRFPPPTLTTAPQQSAWTSDSPPLAHAS